MEATREARAAAEQESAREAARERERARRREEAGRALRPQLERFDAARHKPAAHEPQPSLKQKVSSSSAAAAALCVCVFRLERSFLFTVSCICCFVRQLKIEPEKRCCASELVFSACLRCGKPTS